MANFLKEINGMPRGTAMVLTDLPSIANSTILGNISGGSSTPSALTVAQVNTLLGDVTTLAAVGATPNANGASISGNTLTLQPFDSTHPGVVTASGGGTTNFLRADGTWAAPTGNTTFYRAGQQTIGSASSSQAITFSSTLGTTNYGISVVMKNVTDTNPQFQPLEVTVKSATGFTVAWNSPTDTANYVLEYTALPNV